MPGDVAIARENGGVVVIEESKHTLRVDALFQRLPDGATTEQLVWAFERCVGALWQRTAVTLGYITLTAILDRVLHDAARIFPPLADLQLEDEHGVRFDAFRASVTAADQQQIREGIRYFLVSFLTVLGNLTGDILTPVLHAQLDDLTLNGPPEGPETSERGGATQ